MHLGLAILHPYSPAIKKLKHTKNANLQKHILRSLTAFVLIYLFTHFIRTPQRYADLLPVVCVFEITLICG